MHESAQLAVAPADYRPAAAHAALLRLSFSSQAELCEHTERISWSQYCTPVGGNHLHNIYVRAEMNQPLRVCKLLFHGARVHTACRK